ncbi:DUF6455 family protein [Kaarinaea lacus]
MDISLLFITLITLLALVLLFSVAGLTYMMMDNTPQLKKVLEQRNCKEMLRHEVYRYRLSSMLRYLGIRMESYIMKLPEEEIRKHIIRCRTCPSISTCDRCLRDDETMSKMDFCPNYSSLLAYSKLITN